MTAKSFFMTKEIAEIALMAPKYPTKLPHLKFSHDNNWWLIVK